MNAEMRNASLGLRLTLCLAPLALLALVGTLLQPAESQRMVLNGLPYSGTTNSASPAFQVTNTGTGIAISGHAASSPGVFGRHDGSGNEGFLGVPNAGAVGQSASGVIGSLGADSGPNARGGVYGGSSVNGGTPYGWLGTPIGGAFGAFNATGPFGWLGLSNAGVYGQAPNAQTWAGFFAGDVNITGRLFAAAKFFKMDHPLDPENKYLIHACVESDEQLDIYRGRVVTDARGYATITVPDWFAALNEKFEYQLTVLGDGDDDSFVMAKIVKELEDGRFILRTSQPDVTVSWQVTGVRQDAYTKAHPMQVEQDKPHAERGKYLNPVEHGQPETLGIGRERNRFPMPVAPQTHAMQPMSVREAK